MRPVSVRLAVLAWGVIVIAVGTPSACRAETAPGDAAAPAWDYLPVVGYEADSLWLALRVGKDGGSWSIHGPSGELTSVVAEGGATVSASVVAGPRPRGSGDEAIEFTAGARAARVRLARPGAAAGLAIDAGHRLAIGGVPAVLVVDRTEAAADRRWKWFRTMSGAEPVVCDLTLEAPAVSPGESGLLAEIAASQSLEVSGHSVLVMLPRSDIDAGWKRREYRQALAWLVSDALARGAAHVVLAGPIAPKAEAARLEPLLQPVSDVSDAYHCRAVDCSSLCADAYWEIADGIIGPGLNAAGQQALGKLLARWRKP